MIYFCAQAVCKVLFSYTFPTQKKIKLDIIWVPLVFSFHLIDPFFPIKELAAQPGIEPCPLDLLRSRVVMVFNNCHSGVVVKAVVF